MLEKKLDFFPRATYVLSLLFVLLFHFFEKRTNKTQNQNTHENTNADSMNRTHFHSRVGREGSSKILTKDLSHPNDVFPPFVL